MSWWKQLLGSENKRKTPPVAAGKPAPTTVSAPSETIKINLVSEPAIRTPQPSPRTGDTSEAVPPLNTAASNIPARTFSTQGWMDRDALASIQETGTEEQLLRQIRDLLPQTPEDELLFRYYLSKQVHFGDYPLPPLPASSSRILELSRHPDIHLSDYTNVVEADPGLVKTVLQMANSAYYAAAVECTSLPQAIIRIGLKGVEKIALAQAISNRVFRVRGHESLLRSLVRHSIASGIGAQHAAYALGTSQADSFIMGLFHDCGKLVLLSLIADVQRKLKQTATLRLIGQAFDAFHIPVGTNACRKWALSDNVIKATANHHTMNSDSDIVQWCVGLGDHLAYLAGAGDPFVTLVHDTQLLAASGIKETEWNKMTEKVKTELEEFRKVLE